MKRIIFALMAILILFFSHPTYSQTWTQVNTDGFGDPYNGNASSMAVYNGDLYVGTYNWMYTGTEVWKYDGNTWTQVNTDGFGNPSNSDISSMAVYKNNLYVGTYNEGTGTEVWKYDGSTWTQVNTDGFGDANNIAASCMAVYDGNLYMGTWNYSWAGAPTGTEIWRYDGSTWTQVNTDGFGDPYTTKSSNMAVYDGNLYVGAYNWGGPRANTGREVWKYDGSNWTKVNTNFTNKYYIFVSMAVYNNNLYIGTDNTFTGLNNGAEVWRYDGTTWTQVSTDGFGDQFNWVASSMAVYKNNLYVGTLNGATGTEVWRYDGSTWTQVNTDGFGDIVNVSSRSMVVYDGNLYVGTGCPLPPGTEVWRYEFETPTHTLLVTKSGTGNGTVTSNPGGINCGSDCSEEYTLDSIVSLTATPDIGSTFIGWSGDADCSDGQVTMNANKTCIATFTLNQYSLTVNKSGTGNGTVTSNPTGINCGGDCSENYYYNTIVTLTATPDIGSTFIGWSGDADCSDGQVTMNANKTCIATFTLNQYSLTVNKSGTGSGTITSNPAGINCGADCTELYNPSTAVTLSALADTGSLFAGWSGGGCSGTGDCVITMNANTSVTGTFNLSDAPDLSGAWSNISKRKMGTRSMVSGRLTIYNTGTKKASQATVRIYLSDNTTYDPSDQYLGYKTFTVNAGSSAYTIYNYFATTDPQGKYFIAVIDPDNKIKESREDNNIALSSSIP